MLHDLARLGHARDVAVRLADVATRMLTAITARAALSARELEVARRSPALDEFRGHEHLPGDEVASDDEIREFTRNYAQNVYHPVGVHGIEGLRVADASVMPYIVNANATFPSIMIGVKCADLLRSS